MIKNFLSPAQHQNPLSGSKVTAILLKGWIWSIGVVALGRVCSCSLHSRLVYYHIIFFMDKVVELVGGGTVINRATPFSLHYGIHRFQQCFEQFYKSVLTTVVYTVTARECVRVLGLLVS